MGNDVELLSVLRRHGVRFVVIGGHAVNFHGFGRATEDTDIVWPRSARGEQSLLDALVELESRYIGEEIDPATGIERTYPVTLPFIQSTRLMMLLTKHGFLDVFDHVPGVPTEDAAALLASSISSGGFQYASLDQLRRMKIAAARSKDRLDLENLPE